MWCYNTQIMTLPDVEPKRSQSKKFRRQVWLQIYLPLALGIFTLAILVGGLLLNQTGTESVGADASLTMILIPVLVLGLIFLVLLIALSYLVARLVGYLPTPMSRIHRRLMLLDRTTQRLARSISRLFMYPGALLAAIAAALRGLASIFKRSI